MPERSFAMREPATTTLSSKHQVTLPMAVVRELGVEPGDKFTVRLEDGAITMRPRPRSWVDYISGSMPGYYGKTKEEVEVYLAEVRAGWAEPLEPLEEESQSKTS
jgi:bifunctional DNA-binding transcriptional regulator/antitoxin component of YhaV-PrlF toxin-antitoxin module